MTTNQQADRLAEAVAWLKSGEAMTGPRTEVAIAVVLDRLATLARTPSVPDDVARDAARYRCIRAQVIAGTEAKVGFKCPETGDTYDAYIDAARASHEGEQP